MEYHSTMHAINNTIDSNITIIWITYPLAGSSFICTCKYSPKTLRQLRAILKTEDTRFLHGPACRGWQITLSINYHKLLTNIN